MRIEEMTTSELKKELTKNPVVILPIGATEAHGPHLPLGTDSFQPEAMADMLAERIDGLVAPPIKYGHHSSTKNMIGTIGISFDTLRALSRDILEALVADGFGKFVILSGHAGHVHMAALKVAVEEVVRTSKVKIMLLTDYDIAWEVSEEMGIKDKDGHGGLIETSRIMAIAPGLVGEKRGSGRFCDQEYMVVANPEICYPDGYAGPANEATPELGNRVNDHIVDRLEELIRRNMGD
ncbi:MAG: creatininase family protein [Methanomassiliicoccales archaeon]|nr:creatininase family protein [Methanomassiliicoccales archaeon]NYT16082.1 creatininase family protein [Methanomassiliicoccales archaeon]